MFTVTVDHHDPLAWKHIQVAAAGDRRTALAIARCVMKDRIDRWKAAKPELAFPWTGPAFLCADGHEIERIDEATMGYELAPAWADFFKGQGVFADDK